MMIENIIKNFSKISIFALLLVFIYLVVVFYSIIRAVQRKRTIPYEKEALHFKHCDKAHSNDIKSSKQKITRYNAISSCIQKKKKYIALRISKNLKNTRYHKQKNDINN